MLTYRTGAAGSPSSATAMATYLMEATVPTAEAQLAAYYAQEKGQEEGLALGMGTTPMPRADIHPELAKALGLTRGKAVTTEEFANLLMGKRTDGGEWPGEPRQPSTPAVRDENGEVVQKERVSLAYVDLTLSAPKSVSVAWAFAPEAERQSIAQAHRSARDQTLAYIAEEIGKKGFGKGHSEGEESADLAWVTCDHYTARPTLSIVRSDPKTGVVDTELYTVPGNHIAGDPHLHSHCIVPNLMYTESGRMVSLDLDMLKDRVHEFGAVYQALLAQEINKLGMDAGLDEKTLMAKMWAVPDHVVEAFSKRTRDAEGAAREQATKEGLDWDGMTGKQQVAFLKAGAARTRLQKAELADVFAWREQARALNYDPKSFYAYGPFRPEMTEVERKSKALETALPLFSDELMKRAVVSGGDARLAAARGLIDWGLSSTEDIGDLTKGMHRQGVLQKERDEDGQVTGKRHGLLWRVNGRGQVKITTTLHKSQEEELISLGRKAAANMVHALRPMEIDAAIRRSGLDFTGKHGESQRDAVKALGEQGGLAVMIGAAGTGKTKQVLPPLVDAWKAKGYEVWGTALAWRQATDLREAGIDRVNCRAMSPFLKAFHNGNIKLNSKSVIVLDELGQIGTRQLLDVLRIVEETGAKLVAMGDDRQCQSIEAGPVIQLLRDSLGNDVIPEIYTTIRQNSKEEREIVGKFRSGEIEAAVGAKRANGTAELVEGGYRQAINRVADLYAEQRKANPDFSISISAPTNADAREISRAVREVRRAMEEVGPDRETKAASDGRGDLYQVRLAEGDNIRLFKRTRAVFTDDQGRKKSANIGDNGTVLKVVEVVQGEGLKLRGESGKVGFVSYDELKWAKQPDRLAITYGDSGTIDSSQGITSDIHIHAFPSGSQGVAGFKNYVAQSRHRVKSFMIGSMGAEMKGALASRPLGLPELKGADAQDAAWSYVVKNFKRVPVKESALDMLTRLTTGKRKAAEALQSGLRKQETRKAAGLGSTLGDRFKHKHATQVLTKVAAHMEQAGQDRAEAIEKIKEITMARSKPDQQGAASAPVARPARPQAPHPAPTSAPKMWVKVSKTDAEVQFKAFAEMHGLRISGAPVMDGERHYVQVEGNRGREKSGAYMAFYEGARPAGVVWNYKTSTKVNWKADGEAVPMTEAEARTIERKAEADRIARAAQQSAREEAGSRRAQAIMDASVPARADHPYLVAKGIAPNGARQNKAGDLLIPLYTPHDGKLWNVQTISADGTKRPVPGAKKIGTVFVMGEVKAGKPLIVLEGFATTATVHEATGAASAMAIDTSNLGPATRALHQTYPNALLAMGADNDLHLPLRPAPRTLPNAGVKKSTEIANELGARVLVPEAIPARTADDKGTDWNDYSKHHGLEATRMALRGQWRESVAEGPDLKVKAPGMRIGQ